MRTKTRIATTVAAGLLAAAGFTAVAAAADDTTTGDVLEMHQQMGGTFGAGMGSMSGAMDVETMQAVHDAIDPAAMDAMHAQMRELLPPELRGQADAMHASMTGVMGDGAFDHGAHHRGG